MTNSDILLLAVGIFLLILPIINFLRWMKPIQKTMIEYDPEKSAPAYDFQQPLKADETVKYPSLDAEEWVRQNLADDENMYCHACGKLLQIVRPGLYQCVNPKCKYCNHDAVLYDVEERR